MKLPIPSDWDGESWLCAEIQWPNSAQYIGILYGLLTEMTRGRLWNEDTGIITDAQEIGWLVHDANLPLRVCSDSGQPPVQPEKEIVYLFDNCDESGDCQMSCSIPFGALRWYDGKLQYRYCGEWYDVDGSFRGDDWTDDETEVNPPEDYLANTTACAKAVAWTDVLFGVVDTALDMTTGQAWPIGIQHQLGLRYPGVKFGALALANVFAAALNIAAAGYAAQTESPTVQQRMRCLVASVLDDETAAGMTPSEYAAAKNVVDSVASQSFKIFDFPLTFGNMFLIYHYAAASIGAEDSRKITQWAQPQDGVDCECPGERGVIPIEPTNPDEQGWYLGVNWAKDIEQAAETNQTWNRIVATHLAEHDSYGSFLVLKVVNPAHRISRMNIDDALDDYTPPVNDRSLWGNTSDELNKVNTAFPIISSLTQDIRLSLAAQRGFSGSVDGGTNGIHSTNIAQPEGLIGEIIGACLNYQEAASYGIDFVVEELRLVHNVNSPSHS